MKKVNRTIFSKQNKETVARPTKKLVFVGLAFYIIKEHGPVLVRYGKNILIGGYTYLCGRATLTKVDLNQFKTVHEDENFTIVTKIDKVSHGIVKLKRSVKSLP